MDYSVGNNTFSSDKGRENVLVGGKGGLSPNWRTPDGALGRLSSGGLSPKLLRCYGPRPRERINRERERGVFIETSDAMPDIPNIS
jgi:hypothetical protein